jgi:dTDP-4-amino-4,6-dideoxygalactose transaminase
MDRKGVELLIRDTTPNHKLKGLKMDHFKLPVTDELATRSVRLPTYPELTNREVKYVIDAIRSYYA